MYYFVPKIAIDDNSNLFKPFRIIELREDFPFKPKGIPGYSTIKELRKNDKNWKKYHKQDSKSAVKICDNKFIITAHDFVLTPRDEEFNEVSYKLLKHTVIGELSNDIMGIHLISKLNPNIRSVIQTSKEDCLGIWKADIEYFSKERGKVYLKKDSSMFPKNWDPSTFMFKIYGAYKSRKQCELDEDIFYSMTDCGIPVEFIIKNNVLKTVYPIYQETKHNKT